MLSLVKSHEDHSASSNQSWNIIANTNCLSLPNILTKGIRRGWHLEILESYEIVNAQNVRCRSKLLMRLRERKLFIVRIVITKRCIDNIYSLSNTMPETIIETKQCRQCQTPFVITDQDREFLVKLSPSFAGKKYLLPDPTLCPDCRQQHLLCRRNERTLYKRTCARSQQPIISMYSPDKPYVVYDQEQRWKDGWDPLAYGQEFDFSRPFRVQFEELMKKVPLINLII